MFGFTISFSGILPEQCIILFLSFTSVSACWSLLVHRRVPACCVPDSPLLIVLLQGEEAAVVAVVVLAVTSCIVDSTHPFVGCCEQRDNQPSCLAMHVSSEYAFAIHQLSTTPSRQTRRPSSGVVQFKVGDVVRHRRYHYRGVIYGWDPECKAEEEWMQQMRIDQLPGMHAMPVLARKWCSQYSITCLPRHI